MQNPQIMKLLDQSCHQTHNTPKKAMKTLKLAKLQNVHRKAQVWAWNVKRCKVEGLKTEKDASRLTRRCKKIRNQNICRWICWTNLSKKTELLWMMKKRELRNCWKKLYWMCILPLQEMTIYIFAMKDYTFCIENLEESNWIDCWHIFCKISKHDGILFWRNFFMSNFPPVQTNGKNNSCSQLSSEFSFISKKKQKTSNSPNGIFQKYWNLQFKQSWIHAESKKCKKNNNQLRVVFLRCNGWSKVHARIACLHHGMSLPTTLLLPSSGTQGWSSTQRQSLFGGRSSW